MSEKIAFKISCVKFQERIALAFILKWPYFWVRKVGILRWLVADQQVSYLCKFLENVNQSLNIEGTCLLIDLLMKRIFSNVILSQNFKILFEEKSRLEWNNWSLKFIIRSAFFWRIINLLTVLILWAKALHE